jgi:hypothetical protein
MKKFVLFCLTTMLVFAVDALAFPSPLDTAQRIFDQMAKAFVETPQATMAEMPASFSSARGRCAAKYFEVEHGGSQLEYFTVDTAPGDLTLRCRNDSITKGFYAELTFEQGFSRFYSLAALPLGDIGDVATDGYGNQESTFLRHQRSNAAWLLSDELTRPDGSVFQKYCWFSEK